MSTRATYEIGGETFYIHYDGYPAGAAGYFANMIEAMTVPAKSGGIEAIESRRGGARFAFIRGNMLAEPTESHDAHGDTEYRWRLEHVEGRGFVIQAQTRTGFDGYKWSAWSAPRPLAEFINAHYPGLIVEIEAPDRYWKHTLTATLEHALGIAEAHRRRAAGYADGNPNKAPALEHAAAWERAIVELLPARVRWLEKEKAECADELAKHSTWGREYHERRFEEIRRELEFLSRPIGAEHVAA
jgi:hypothetical protein